VDKFRECQQNDVAVNSVFTRATLC